MTYGTGLCVLAVQVTPDKIRVGLDQDPHLRRWARHVQRQMRRDRFQRRASGGCPGRRTPGGRLAPR